MPTDSQTIARLEKTVAEEVAAYNALAESHAELLAALEGTAFWQLAADESPCWCALNDLEPDDERHLPACKVARAAVAKARKL